MRVLITGGAGYVGGFLTDAVREAGHEVRVFDSLLYEDLYLKNVDFAFGDVTDGASLLPHLGWADCVIFLAGFVGDPLCALDPALTKRVNIDAINHLCANFGGQIIFPSTCSVYGAQEALLTETSEVRPLSLYAETKVVAEEIIKARGGDSQIFRLGTLFGLSDTYSRLRADLVLNTLTIRAVLEGQMTVFGGRQYRPLLHVRDVATAMVPTIGRLGHGLYNLHAENLTIIDLAKRIQSQIPDAEIIETDSKFQDARNYQVSSALITKTTGFYPRYSIDDGITEVSGAVREGRIKNVHSPRFSNVAAMTPVIGRPR